MVDADGTHATLVAKGARVSAGAGGGLSPAGIAKLLPAAAAFAWKALPSTTLTIPTSSYSCGPSCTVSVSATSATARRSRRAAVDERRRRCPRAASLST